MVTTKHERLYIPTPVKEGYLIAIYHWIKAWPLIINILRICILQDVIYQHNPLKVLQLFLWQDTMLFDLSLLAKMRHQKRFPCLIDGQDI